MPSALKTNDSVGGSPPAGREGDRITARGAETTGDSRPARWRRVGVSLAGGVWAALFRLIPHWPNFTPVGGLALFAGARLRLWQAFVVTLAVMAASDLLMWAAVGKPAFDLWVYGCFAANVLLGRLLLKKGRPWRIPFVSLLGSLLFFAVTNFGTWVGSNSIYPKTPAGLAACYVAALPFAGDGRYGRDAVLLRDRDRRPGACGRVLRSLRGDRLRHQRGKASPNRMKFAAIIEYLQEPEKVNSLRPMHRQYLLELKAQRQLAATGPFTDGSGAVIVYEAASVEEAEQLLKGDPFSKNGVFLKYVLRPWNPVFANRELFPAT